MFDKVVIVDQSTAIPEEPAVLSPERPTAFFPIFSNKGFGRDSEVKFFEGFSHNALINAYGQPNLNTTLAPLYYAHEFIRGGGAAYIGRIASPTAALSNVVIVAKARESADDATKLEVKFELQTIEETSDFEELITSAEALINLTPDAEEQWVTYPIAVVSMKWAGVEGNKYTFRLLPDRQLDKAIPQRGYQLEVRQSLATKPKVLQFSTSEVSELDGVAIYANDYLEDISDDVVLHMLNTSQQFVEYAAEYLPAGEETPDVFFGLAKGGSAYPNYTIHQDSVDFTAVGGLSLQSGTDGTFATSDSQRTSNMMQAMADAFSNESIAVLENEYKYHIDFVFDFGASQEVKDAMEAFVNRRKTTGFIMDTGFEKSKTAILNMRTSGDIDYDNGKITIVSGCGATRDPFSRKRIIMPLSYFEAFATANHIVSYEGGSRPFAGDLYRYTNMIEGSYQPYFYSEEEDIVEELVDNRVNFAFDDTVGYSAFHQSTSLKAESALAERNNMYILHKIVRECLMAAKAERWNFAEDSDIEKYEESINQRVGVALEGRLGSFELTAVREGEIGPARNRVAVTATIRFKFINKGTTFTFVVI